MWYIINFNASQEGVRNIIILLIYKIVSFIAEKSSGEVSFKYYI